jgi:hypothetical protein
MKEATIKEVTATETNTDTPARDATRATSSVKQWFCGEIEASYYGIPSRVPAASSDSIGRRYRLHIYRAAVLQAKPINDPVDTQGDAPVESENAERQTEELFFQESIEVAQLWGVRGPGTRYEGPIHDVSITQPQTRFHVVKDNKGYGTLRGFAQGWMYLPRNVTPVPPTQLDQTNRELPMGVVIRESPQENAAKGVAVDNRAPKVGRNDKSEFVERAPDTSVDDVDTTTMKRMTSSQKTEPPYFSLCAAVGLLLWFTCDAEQTWIWCLFMLPTLGMRRLLFEVLPDERGVQAFAAVLVLGAILSAGTILASFSAANCWTLETVPLVVLVGSVFLSGIVPYRLPLAITALTFAAVLYMWGHAPERHCPPHASEGSLPTIKNPGVPRTNDDGTWPRRLPTTEN